MSAPLKIVTYPALFRTQKIIIIAEMAKVNYEVDTKTSQDQLSSMSVFGKVPCLVTPEGNISESNAIARYIGRMAPASLGICGASAFESAQVDSWMDFCVQDLEIPATLWIAPILGWMDNDAQVTKRASEDLHKGLSVLESHLKMETFLVGRQVTMADVAVATTLLLPLKLVLDAGARKKYPSVMRWFDLISNQQAFVDTCGKTTLCVTPMVAAASKGGNVNTPAKEQKKKEEKPKAKEGEGKKGGEKRKQEAAAPAAAPAAPAPKPKNPMDELPKSNFVLDAWKREYSNAPGMDTTLAMPYFWDNYDPEGYSLWYCDYKYNDECTVVFRTSNLVAGFVQRTEELRKYAFGVMQIIGSQEQQKVTGAWLVRGQSIEPLLEANADAEHYTWTKLDQPPTDEQKARLNELWNAAEKIDGMDILDCKVFK